MHIMHLRDAYVCPLERKLWWWRVNNAFGRF